MTSSSPSSYLTCAEFVEEAILFEQESASFYHGLRSQTTGAAHQLAEMMEKQELAHERILRELDVSRTRELMQFPPERSLSSHVIPEGEIPLAELIEIGIEREHLSRVAYEHAARFVTGEFQQLLEGLAHFEEEHEQKLISMRGL
jgi:rubrerythrin